VKRARELTDVERFEQLLRDPNLSPALRTRLRRVLELCAAGALGPADMREAFEAGQDWAAELRKN
jgi:hypothetical protein